MNTPALKALTEFIYELKYSDDQPRDDSGRWSDTGGGSSGGGNGGSGDGGDSSNPDISFGDTPASGAQAQALGNRIVVDKQTYRAMGDEARLALVAHEYAHNKIENHILSDNDEWNKASDALLIAERNGRQLFISGETRIGEAIVNVIASKVVGTAKPSAYSSEQWDKAMNWADYAIGKYGGKNFVSDIHKQKRELDSQL